MEKKPKRKRLQKTLIITGIIVIAGAATATYFLWPRPTKDAVPNKTPTTSTERTAATQTAIDTSRSTVASGDTASAIKILDTAIEKTPDTTQKAALYSEKSLVQANTGDTADAAQTAAQAADLNPIIGLLDYAAQLYERSADKPNAIIYYQKALEAYDKAKPREGNGIISHDYYVNKINGLGGHAS